MGRLNMKEWISQTIQRKETIAIPIMTHPGIEFIGKTVHDAVTNGQVHYEATGALFVASTRRRPQPVTADPTAEAKLGQRLSFRKMRYPVYPAVYWRMKLLLKSWKFRR